MEIDLKKIPDKKYFSTIEVSKIVGIEAHTLRYWEKEFGSLFNVKKTSNQRIFKKNDIVNFLKIKSLIKKEGMTIKGAKSKICLLYTSPSPRDKCRSRMPSSA